MDGLMIDIDVIVDPVTGLIKGYRNPVTRGDEYAPFLPIPLSTGNNAAAATTNTTAIQAALNAGGLVQITTPGTFYIGGVVTAVGSILTIYDNTKLLLGPNTVLKQADNNGGYSMIRNSNYNSTIYSVSAISCANTSPALLGYRRVTVNCTGHPFTVGTYALIKGDTSNGGLGSYNGVWQVDTVPDANSFTFLYMNTADPSSGSGTMTAALANANIVIEGGTIDHNKQGNQSAHAVGTDTLAVVLNKVRNCWILNQRGQNGMKYLWHFSNYWNCGGKNLEVNTGSDGLHFKGPGWNAIVDTVTGQNGDDMVAFVTQDVLQADINPPDTGGDMRGIIVRNVGDHHSNVHNAVVIVPNQSQTISGVIIDGVTCAESGYQAVGIYTNLTESGTVQDCIIRNITGGFAGSGSAAPMINIAGPSSGGTLTLGNILIDGVTPRDPSSNNLVSVTGRINYTEISMKGIKQRPLSLVDPIKISGASVVGEVINIEDCRGDFDLTNAAGNCRLALIASATVKRARISRCRINGSGSTRTMYFYQVFAPASGARYEVVDSESDGNAQMVELSTITNIPTLYFRGVTYNASANYFLSGSDSFTLIASDIDILSCVDIFILAGTSKTYTFNLSNFKVNGKNFCTNYGTTNTINWNGGDGSFRLNFDASKLTIASGSLYYNTNAAYGAGAGMYAQGASAGTRIAA